MERGEMGGKKHKEIRVMSILPARQDNTRLDHPHQTEELRKTEE